MEDQSYDGTEQTPQPKSFRPPPMHHLGRRRKEVETPQSFIRPPMTATRSAPRLSHPRRTTAVESLESSCSSYSCDPPDFLSTTTATATGGLLSHALPPLPSPLLWSAPPQRRGQSPHGPSLATGGSSVVSSSSSSSSSLSATLDGHVGQEPVGKRPSPRPPPPMDEVQVQVEPTYHHHYKYPDNHDTYQEEEEEVDTLVERTERSLRRVMPTKNIRSSPSTTGSATTTTTTMTVGGGLVGAATTTTSTVPRSQGVPKRQDDDDRHHSHHPTSSPSQQQRHSLEEVEETLSSSSLSHILSTASSYRPTRRHHHPQQQQRQPSLLEVSKIQETALQALIHLKQELGKSQERTKELLRKQREELEDQWQGTQSEWKGQMERLETSLYCATSSKRELEEQVLHLKEQQKQGEEQRKAAALREQKESLHRKLTTNNRIKELKQSWEDTKKELAQLNQRHSQLQQEHSTLVQEKNDVEQENSKWKAQREDNETTMSTFQLLQGQLEAKEHEVACLTTTVSQLKESHHQEMEQWKAQANELKTTLEQLKAQHPSMATTSTTSTPRTHGNRTSRVEDSGGPPTMIVMDPSVSDRLARMRDSAERAHLIKGHQRELARLKMDHEHELQKLQDSHQDALRHVQEESRMSLQSQIEQVKRVLKQENEDVLQKSRAEQREKCAEMQKEFMQQQEAVEKALQKALGKISGLTHQCEREVSHRAGMELKYAQLKHQWEEQRRQLQEKYASDLQAQKKEWEFERDTLLTMIQRDCNSAFENHRRTAPSSNHSSTNALPESPKGVDFDFLPPSAEPTLRVDTGAKSASAFWTMQTSSSDVNVISPMMYSEIDEVLRETEELIRSIS